MDNALKEIGLIEVNERIIDRNTYYNNLNKTEQGFTKIKK